MKRALFALFLLALGGAILYGLWKNPAEKARALYAARAQEKTFVRELSADGKVAGRRLGLAFVRPGKVAEVAVSPGDRVQKGQLIARLEDREERRKLELARSRLRAFLAESEGKRKRLELELRALEQERRRRREALELTRALFQAGAASQTELREREHALRETETRLAQLLAERRSALAAERARRAELEAALAEAEQALAETRLVAPEAGVVETVPFVPGAPARGEAVLALTGTLVPEALFPEAEAAEIRPDQPARLEFTAWPEEPKETRVRRLLPPRSQQGAVWVPVRFDPPENAALAPDLTFTAYVEVERIEHAVVVPLEALVEEDGKTYVWTVEDGKAHKRAVERRAQNLTEAAVSGLKAGTVVLRLPPDDLAEGERVQPILEDEGAGGA